MLGLLVGQVRPQRGLADERPLALGVPSREGIRGQGQVPAPHEGRAVDDDRCARRLPIAVLPESGHERRVDARQVAAVHRCAGGQGREPRHVRRQVEVVPRRVGARERAARADVVPEGDPAARAVASLRQVALDERRVRSGEEGEVGRGLARPDVAAAALEERTQAVPRGVALRVGLAGVVDDVEALQRVGGRVLERVRSTRDRDEADVGAEDLA